jgi:hypothetical protein
MHEAILLIFPESMVHNSAQGKFICITTASEAHCLHYKAKPINAVRKVTTIYCGNNVKHINAFCIQNGES